MGDPKKTRKKYTTPAHMWQGTRIEDEYKLKKEFGLKNNTEIWRAEAFVRNARDQVRKLIGKSDEKAENQKKLLLGRLTRLGIISKDSTMSDILAINVRNVLDRRLQTILNAKGIAKSSKEARQMIVHGQVKYKGRKHTLPGSMVSVADEATISYTGPSRTVRPPRKKETSPSIEAKVEEGATQGSEDGAKKEEPKAEEKKEESKPEEKKEANAKSPTPNASDKEEKK
jgi:small subunit ribosomal protein S4|tara:strand:+ start:1268 stop:1951 length:684 start_codon:yes stop_codon:yes gene_type:complete